MLLLLAFCVGPCRAANPQVPPGSYTGFPATFVDNALSGANGNWQILSSGGGVVAAGVNSTSNNGWSVEPSSSPSTFFYVYAPVGTASGTYEIRVYWSGATGANAAYFDVVGGGSSVPSAPTGLTATAGNGQVTLTWAAPGSGTAPFTYSVYRGTSPGGEGASPVATTSTVGYIDTNVSSGQTYYYYVTAGNSVGTSPHSNEASATPQGANPVTNLKAAPGNAAITLTWTASANATGYVIYRGTASSGESYLTSVGAVTTDTDTGLTNGQTYFYEVAATTASGTGPLSNEASAAPTSVPQAPTNLTYFLTNPSGQSATINLTWNAVPGATSYTVWNMTYSRTVQGTTTTTGYTTTGGQGNYYRFVVSASNAAGQSGDSNQVQVYVPYGPSVPTLSAAADSHSNGTIDLSWTPDGNTTYSIIQRSTSSTGPFSLLTYLTNAISYVDTGLTNGTTYYYEVCGSNVFGNSSYSNIAHATPAKPQPLIGTGTGLTALYFNDPDDGTYFNVATTASGLGGGGSQFSYNWGSGLITAQQHDDTSVRWVGQVQPEYSDTYTFSTQASDGVRLWVNGQLLVSDWQDHASPVTDSGTITLTAGQLYSITLEYYKHHGPASVALLWSSPNQPNTAIPTTQLYPGSEPGFSTVVTVTSPAAGATFQMGDAPTLTASVAYAYSPTSQVDFYATVPVPGQASKTVRLGTAPGGSGSQFSVTSIGLPPGNLSVVAIVTDTQGDRILSPPVSIQVGGSPGLIGTGTGLTGLYYNYLSTGYTPVLLTRTDSTVNFQWGGVSPDANAGIAPANFLVQWEGQVQPKFTEPVTFSLNTTGAVYLYVNGQPVISNWTLHSGTDTSAPVTLTAGQTYPILLQYYQNAANPDGIALSWASASLPQEVVPQSQLYLYPTEATPDPATRDPLAVNVVWTTDDTASPPTQTASNSGPVGGNAGVHVSFKLPTGASSPYLQGLTIHEEAGSVPDVTVGFQQMTGSASALCGDPASGGGVTMAYFDLPWPAGGQNGPYDITASVWYSLGGVWKTMTQKITVTRADLLLTGTRPANPTPIAFAGTGPVTVTATVSAAYKANGTATLSLYASDQTFIKTLPAQPFLTSAGQVSFTWDGTLADGTPAQPGVYLFQCNVTDSLGVSDTDKSAGLAPISVTSDDATLLSDDGTTATFSVDYTLTSNDSPARPGSAGRIDVYDPNQNVCASQPLGSGDLTPGAHTVTVSMPSPQLDGDYTFLTCVQDSDASSDRGHRSRYALQHNNKYIAARLAFLQINGMYVAWAHPHKHVIFGTDADSSGPSHSPHTFAQVNPNTNLRIRAAVNGIFFRYGKHHNSDGTVVNKFYPIGEVGPAWKIQDIPTPVQRWSFGLSLSGEDQFIASRMIPFRRGSHIYYVVDPHASSGTFGMSDAGLLVTTDLDPATGRHVAPHQPIEVPLPYNGTPTYPFPSTTAQGDELNRTAIAWSTNGDFFLICGQVPGATVASTWDNMANFIINALPNDPHILPFHVQVRTGMMVDGGSVSEFSYNATTLKNGKQELLNNGRPMCTIIMVGAP